jgi:hypothetical protein
MYMDLKKYIVNYASDDSKRTNVAMTNNSQEASVVSVQNTSIKPNKQPEVD